MVGRVQSSSSAANRSITWRKRTRSHSRSRKKPRPNVCRLIGHERPIKIWNMDPELQNRPISLDHDGFRKLGPKFHAKARRGAAHRWLGVVVNDLGSLAKAHMAQAREQIRELVGEIRLTPTADGYLEAVLTGRYEGLLKLAVRTKLNNMVAGEGFEPSTFGL